jgi:hypothetical protein
MQTIDIILRNELYLGHNVFNRRSRKLKQKTVCNPPEMWVRCEHAFKPLILPALFAKAQKVLSDLKYRQTLSDEDLLKKLRVLWRRKGRLSIKLMHLSKSVPHFTVYERRFGSILAAYRLVGYRPQRRYDFAATGETIDTIIRTAASDLISDLRSAGEVATFLPELYLLSVGGITLVMSVAWSVSDGTVAGRRSRRWEVRKIKYRRSDLTLVIRMDKTNATIQDYFLVPTPNLPVSKDRKKLRISDRIFGNFGHNDFKSVVLALHERLRQRHES